MNNIKIAIVEDHTIVMEGLIMLLEKEPDLTVIGGFTEADSFLSIYKELELDIVVIDIFLGDKNGLDICRQLKKERPHIAVLILSNVMERSVVLQALQDGANGYLIKNTSSEKLLEAITEIRLGNLYFSPEITEIIAKASIGTPTGLPSITKREHEILKLIASGSTTQLIANQLSISPFTVETHRRNLLQKFKVNNMAELVMVAAQNKLL